MTSPTGGGGQNINLAALWIPVLPDTSKMAEEMRKSGAEAKTQFEQGFNSSGSSPEAMGANFTAKMNESMRKGFSELEIPFGGSRLAEWFDKFGGEVDEKVVNKLKGQATEALRSYGAEHDKLSAAQDRSTEAENRLNLARDNGFNKASIMIPLLREQTAAHTALADQTQRTTAAHEQLTTVTGKLSAEQSKAATGSELMAGIMGGLVVVGAGLALKAVEAFADFLKEGLEEGIEITKELAEQTLELGEKYEQIGLGVREFSSASGEAFEELESRAQKVFGTLDVAGENTGQTFAQLTSILGDAIPDSLVRHIEELQGRFSNLKAQDVASIFYSFKVPAQETDSVLASLTESARSAGQGVGDLVNALKGDASEVLREAGLNAQQAGEFIANMMKLGTSGRSVISGIPTVMKEAAKEGLSFSDGMKLAGQRLQELGDTAGGQELAEKLFGTRRWATAMAAAQEYVDVVSQGPDAFNQNSASLDEFLQQTQTLENKWEEVKHKIEEALMPLGLGAIDLVDSMINGIKKSFDTHLPEIRTQIKSLGDSFLDNLPVMQDFVAGAISLMGPLFDFIKEGALLVTGTLGGLVDIYAQVTGDDKLHESMVKFGEAQKKIQDIDFTKLGDQVSGYVSGININSEEIKKKFDAMWDSARGEGADQQSPGEPIPDMTPHGDVPGVPPGFPAPSVAPPPGPPPAGTPLGDLFNPHPAAAGSQGVAQSIYNAVRAAGYGDDTAVAAVAAAMHESGLDPNNPNNPNHFGLFQETADKPHNGAQEQIQWFISALQKAGGPGVVDKDPANVIADKVEVGGYSGSVYDLDAARKALGNNNGSGPGGEGLNPNADPSVAGQGLNLSTVAVAAQKFANDCIDASARIILSHSGVNMSEDDLKNVITPGTNIDVLSAGLNRLDPQGAFRAMPGSGGSQEAMFAAIKASIDNGTGSILNVAPGSALAGHVFAPGHFIAATGYNADGTINVSDTASGTKYSVSEADAFQATSGRGIVAGTGTGPSATAGPASVLASAPSYSVNDGSSPGGKAAGYTGLPGQYGGSGVYGGETADQAYAAAKAVREAQDRASDMDAQIAKQQRSIQDIKDQLAQVNAPKIGLLGQPEVQTPEEAAAAADKAKRLNEQLSDATESLARSQRERAEQDGEITQAQRKQQESMYKKPSGTGQTGQGSAAQTLGSGLLAGIGQELGLGDVLGKSPMDWGIVKLAEGLFNYANGLGDAIFGKTDSMGGPGGAGGLGGGMATGLLGSLGLKLPTGSISAATNVIPGPPPGTPASGMGAGALPGPPVVNQDNSITVQAGVSDKTVVNAIKPQQDSVNSQAFQYTGGFPAS